ncbi:MAG: hypothetical protein K9I74_04055 [Bacteroidales bacterium]|nr:hypothetical protein [Bacteroidales bacterium]
MFSISFEPKDIENYLDRIVKSRIFNKHGDYLIISALALVHLILLFHPQDYAALDEGNFFQPERPFLFKLMHLTQMLLAFFIAFNLFEEETNDLKSLDNSAIKKHFNCNPTTFTPMRDKAFSITDKSTLYWKIATVLMAAYYLIPVIENVLELLSIDL